MSLGHARAASRPILVTGINGQVGHELCRALLPLGPLAAFSRRELDLADPDAIIACVRRLRPALIVNAAAYTAVEQAEDDEATALAINGRAPGILAEEAARVGAGLVHYSTDYVFDGTAESPYREDHPVAPLGAYGRSKLAGERAVLAVGQAGIVLRCAWVYAVRGRNFLATIQRLARERDELRVVDDQVGCPTWARYIAEATALMLGRKGLEFERLRECAGLYHLAAAGSVSWCGFARAILAATPGAQATRVVPITSAEYPTRAARPAYSVLDCSRLRDAFGVHAPSWDVQLQLALEDQQALRDTR